MSEQINLQVSNWLYYSSNYEVTLVSQIQKVRNLFIENSPIHRIGSSNIYFYHIFLSVLVHKSSVTY